MTEPLSSKPMFADYEADIRSRWEWNTTSDVAVCLREIERLTRELAGYQQAEPEVTDHLYAVIAERDRLRAALLAWYEASNEEERRWAMELTVPLKESLRGAVPSSE